jgi:hypothetical protein
MRRLAQAGTFIPLFLIAACSAPAAPNADAIVGHWRSDQASLGPKGTMVSELTFSPDGHFSFDVRSYGVYPPQRENELSASSQTVGRYRIEDRRLDLQPESLTEFDAFQPNARVVTTRPYPYDPGPFDQAIMTVSGDRLTLDYLSYPADAPVHTEAQFHRVAN